MNTQQVCSQGLWINQWIATFNPGFVTEPGGTSIIISIWGGCSVCIDPIFALQHWPQDKSSSQGLALHLRIPTGPLLSLLLCTCPSTKTIITCSKCTCLGLLPQQSVKTGCNINASTLAGTQEFRVKTNKNKQIC